jgi:hypothetical protein
MCISTPGKVTTSLARGSAGRICAGREPGVLQTHFDKVEALRQLRVHGSARIRVVNAVQFAVEVEQPAVVRHWVLSIPNDIIWLLV